MAAMAAAGSSGRAELQLPKKKWKERETSPERTKVWTGPNRRKVSVVYYLSRNGQLEHPHFMEVPLSSSDGLFLRDVMNRLNVLRGKGMASMYCWSAKRSYKNGFVWHDLSENDFIYPAHGQEYVLKGSEILEGSPKPKSNETLSSSFRKPPEMHKSGEDSDFPVAVRRRNQSWSSIDLHEYKVYKAESTGECAGKGAADASTQTDDKRRRRRMVREEEEEEEAYQEHSKELSREEISPPPSDSSPETLESLMKADGRLILEGGGRNEEQREVGGGHGKDEGVVGADAVNIVWLNVDQGLGGNDWEGSRVGIECRVQIREDGAGSGEARIGRESIQWEFDGEKET